MPADLIDIQGVRTSADIRAELATAGDPVLLAFSRGKDSLAAWCAMQDAGLEVKPYYLYLIPGLLRFEEESLDMFEQHFQTRIPRYPHPSIYRTLNNLVFQPPERCATIEAAQLPSVDFGDLVGYIREDYGMDPAAWVADGVRAADSPIRRISIAKHGPMKPASRKVSIVWDWRKAHVMDSLKSHGVRLPPDYDWFKRSFDGVDYRFLEPLSRNAPGDYQRILDWYPLADLELVRHAL